MLSRRDLVGKLAAGTAGAALAWAAPGGWASAASTLGGGVRQPVSPEIGERRLAEPLSWRLR